MLKKHRKLIKKKTKKKVGPTSNINSEPVPKFNRSLWQINNVKPANIGVLKPKRVGFDRDAWNINENSAQIKATVLDRGEPAS